MATANRAMSSSSNSPRASPRASPRTGLITPRQKYLNYKFTQSLSGLHSQHSGSNKPTLSPSKEASRSNYNIKSMLLKANCFLESSTYGIIGDDGRKQLRLILRKSAAEVHIKNLTTTVSFRQLYINESNINIANAAFQFSPQPTVKSKAFVLTSFDAEILSSDGRCSYIARKENKESNHEAASDSDESVETIKENVVITEHKIGATSIPLGVIPMKSIVFLNFKITMELSTRADGDIEFLLPMELLSPNKPANWCEFDEDDEDDEHDESDDDDEGGEYETNFDSMSAHDLLTKYYSKEEGKSASGSELERFGNKSVSLTHETIININIEMPREIAILESPTHPQLVIVEPKNSKRTTSSPSAFLLNTKSALAKLHLEGKDSFSVKSDFGMIIKLKSESNNNIWGMIERSNMLFAQVVVHHPANSHQSKNNEFVFIVDRSGSMAGVRIETVKKMLQLFLRSIPEKSLFNIISFGSTHEFLFQNGSTEYNEESLHQAALYVDSMKANFGGTELYPALNELFSKPNPAVNRYIFILTDGVVEEPDEVLDLVKSKCKISEVDITRVFSIGLGSGACKSLISGLAQAGNGICEHLSKQITLLELTKLETGDGKEEMLHNTVISMLGKAVKPYFSDFEFTLPKNFEVIAQAPLQIPPLFAGQSSYFYFALDEEEGSSSSSLSLDITYKHFGNTITQSIILEIPPKKSENEIYGRLIASMMIGAFRSTGRRNPIYSPDLIKRLSEHYKIPSPWVRFSAIRIDFPPGAPTPKDIDANTILQTPKKVSSSVAASPATSPIARTQPTRIAGTTVKNNSVPIPTLQIPVQTYASQPEIGITRIITAQTPEQPRRRGSRIVKLLKPHFKEESGKLVPLQSLFPTVVLLGTAESGKSAIFNQLKRHYGLDKSSEEKLQVGKLIYEQFTAFLRNISLANPQDSNGIKLRELVVDLKSKPENLQEISKLLQNNSFQQTILERYEGRSNDIDPIVRNNLEYFLKRAPVILQNDYCPTSDDLLRIYHPTTDFSEIELTSTTDISSFQLLDFGGNRTERKRWPFGAKPSLILFCASLSEYDQVLIEDNVTNRMKESLDLFAEILNESWSSGVPLICLFTKLDLLQAKLTSSPPHFPNFHGTSADDVASYIVEQYQKLYHQSTGGFAGKLLTMIMQPFEVTPLLKPIDILLRKNQKPAPIPNTPNTGEIHCLSLGLDKKKHYRKSLSKDAASTMLHKLIRLQSARGSWELSPEILHLLGINTASLQPLTQAVEHALKDPDLSAGISPVELGSLVATIVVLAFLGGGLKTLQGEIELVILKALHYIQKHFKTKAVSKSLLHIATNDILKITPVQFEI